MSIPSQDEIESWDESAEQDDRYSSQQEDEELRNNISLVLRAYRHADTNDIELLLTTIQRPEMIIIDEENGLTKTVLETIMPIIKAYSERKAVEAQVNLILDINKRIAGGEELSLSKVLSELEAQLQPKEAHDKA